VLGGRHYTDRKQFASTPEGEGLRKFDKFWRRGREGRAALRRREASKRGKRGEGTRTGIRLESPS